MTAKRTFDAPAQARRRAFGARVQELRRERGWTQEQCAEACGLDRSFLADIERGESLPGLETCWRIAGGLGITLGRLFDGL